VHVVHVITHIVHVVPNALLKETKEQEREATLDSAPSFILSVQLLYDCEPLERVGLEN